MRGHVARKGNRYYAVVYEGVDPATGIVIDRMERNEALVSRFLNDPEFEKMLLELMARRLYDDFRAAR